MMKIVKIISQLTQNSKILKNNSSPHLIQRLRQSRFMVWHRLVMGWLWLSLQILAWLQPKFVDGDGGRLAEQETRPGSTKKKRRQGPHQIIPVLAPHSHRFLRPS